MDKAVIDQFWRQRSATGAGRWTESPMLNFERELLAPMVGANCRILDLGSGSAELSRKLLLDTTHLLAVDKYPGFLEDIPDDPRVIKQCADLESFATASTFDLILLFGVVTHLEADEEESIYEKARNWLAPAGTMVVKNQISRGVELLMDGFSDALQCHYVARYPALDVQEGLLKSRFNTVRIVAYPDTFNRWPTTMHTAFVCSEPYY
ncbi:class I SAM-dependent methyltransferase [Candidatus Accumulibacter sp. ACC003]|uniref:class I SAM-dependent methyltransferase n=1 Tax=Candidatus Accumulibacter sp. ACC003 TaxID=2823334 RepID=UPI0025C4233B|nr:class I SAM-dependent methyltransferase [Candidatus Accumulibacter sp. ACC003]